MQSEDTENDPQSDGTLKRRHMLYGAALGTASLSGCSQVLDFFGGSCQADNTSIEEQAANPEEYYDSNNEMTVVGDAEDTNADRVILDDGSGTAAITSGALYEWQGTATGCKEAVGRYNPDNQGEYDADLVITNGELSDN